MSRSTATIARARAAMRARPRFNYLVHDVSRMRRTLFDQELRPYGITAAQWWLLGTLSRHNDVGMIQTELARAVESGKVSVGGLIERLVAAGLIERRPDERDRRARRLFVTDQGFAVLERIALVAHRLDQQVFAGVDDEALRQAGDVLRAVKENLREGIRTRGDNGWTDDLLRWNDE